MIIVMLAYALLLPTIAGYLFVAIFTDLEGWQTLIERVLVGFGIGTGMLTFEMFIVGLCQIQFTMFIFSAIQAATILIMVFILFKRKTLCNQTASLLPNKVKESSGKQMSRSLIVVIIVLSIWAMLKILFVIYEGSMWPITWWDTMAHWSSGAKFYFYNKGLVLQQDNEHFFGRGYRGFLDYPLHIPLLQVWVALCLGNFHEVYVKSFTVVYFLSIIGLVFIAIKRETSAFPAILIAFFLLAIPLLTYHAHEAYADLPLSYYALCAAIYFQRYMAKTDSSESNKNGYLLLMGTALAIGAWTKGEGILFTIAFTVAILFYHLRIWRTVKGLWHHLAYYFIPIFAMAVPWYLFVFLNNIFSGRGYENFLGKGLHFEVLSIVFEQAILSANFNIIFVFLIPLLFLGWKPIYQSNLKYLLLPLISVMIFYLVIYLTTDNYLTVIGTTALDRNILTFMPMMYYISALTAVKLLDYFRQ